MKSFEPCIIQTVPANSRRLDYSRPESDIRNKIFLDFGKHEVEESWLKYLMEAIEDENEERIRYLLRSYPEFLKLSFSEHKSAHVQFTYQAVDKVVHSFNVLGYAAAAGKLKALEIMLEEFEADPNQVAWNGPTPLHQLIREDKTPYDPASAIYQAAILLMKYGAKPDWDNNTVEGSPRQAVEKTAPNLLNLAWTGFIDKQLGANCRAAFATKDSIPVHFMYQMRRNAVPLALGASFFLGASLR